MSRHVLGGKDIDAVVRSDSRLRERLKQIMGGSVDSHPGLIADLAGEIPHSIELAPGAPRLPVNRYNCFEFALGLAGRREVRLISDYLSSTCCRDNFVQHLTDAILIQTTSPSTGDLVLYCNQQQITHAGLVEDGRILSKWGVSHLWLHGLLEIPAQYGDMTSFYEAPFPNEILAHFIEFAREREGRDLVDSVLDFEPEG